MAEEKKGFFARLAESGEKKRTEDLARLEGKISRGEALEPEELARYESIKAMNKAKIMKQGTDEEKEKVFKESLTSYGVPEYTGNTDSQPKKAEAKKPDVETEKAVAFEVPKETEEEKSVDNLVSVPDFKSETKKDENTKEKTDPEENTDDFIQAWADSHPSWGKLLKSDKLSFGQKAAIVGGALAQLGANVTNGMAAGFRGGQAAPTEWDFKKALEKYAGQEIENVAGSRQSARARGAIAEKFNEMQEKYGAEKMQELFTLYDTYGDNPEQLKKRLESMGIKEDADILKQIYKWREETTATEQTKREKLETEAKKDMVKAQKIQNDVARLKKYEAQLDAETKKELQAALIAAQNAQNNFMAGKYNFDNDHYKLQWWTDYVDKVVSTVSNAAETAGGIATGGLVGGMKDGILKANGSPQMIIRADGTKVMLDPNDNIYATKNPITSGNDNGSQIVHMKESDPLFYQNRLGYKGGAINKDFDYYKKILRGF